MKKQSTMDAEMDPAIRRILDDMFRDVYVAKNEFEAMAAVAVALVRLGDVNAVDVADVVKVLRAKYFELSRQVDDGQEVHENEFADSVMVDSTGTLTHAYTATPIVD